MIHTIADTVPLDVYYTQASPDVHPHVYEIRIRGRDITDELSDETKREIALLLEELE